MSCLFFLIKQEKYHGSDWQGSGQRKKENPKPRRPRVWDDLLVYSLFFICCCLGFRKDSSSCCLSCICCGFSSHFWKSLHRFYHNKTKQHKPIDNFPPGFKPDTFWCQERTIFSFFKSIWDPIFSLDSSLKYIFSKNFLENIHLIHFDSSFIQHLLGTKMCQELS